MAINPRDKVDGSAAGRHSCWAHKPPVAILITDHVVSRLCSYDGRLCWDVGYTSFIWIFIVHFQIICMLLYSLCNTEEAMQWSFLIFSYGLILPPPLNQLPALYSAHQSSGEISYMGAFWKKILKISIFSNPTINILIIY